MFWNEARGYKGVPLSSKIGLTLFLIIAGIGYLFGFFTIYLSYRDTDQKPGLSVEDIRIAFYGAREKTALESAIDGSMKQYFPDEKSYQTVKDWLQAGADEVTWDQTIKPIFDQNCSTCHSQGAQVAGVVTETYADLQPYLKQDTGKPIPRLVSLSHTHVMAVLTLMFLLALVFSQTLYSETFKIIMMSFSFGSIILDIGSWWLAKASGALAPLVIIGGASLGVSFAVLILFSLYDIWFRKARVG